MAVDLKALQLTAATTNTKDAWTAYVTALAAQNEAGAGTTGDAGYYDGSVGSRQRWIDAQIAQGMASSQVTAPATTTAPAATTAPATTQAAFTGLQTAASANPTPTGDASPMTQQAAGLMPSPAAGWTNMGSSKVSPQLGQRLVPAAVKGLQDAMVY